MRPLSPFPLLYLLFLWNNVNIDAFQLNHGINKNPRAHFPSSFKAPAALVTTTHQYQYHWQLFSVSSATPREQENARPEGNLDGARRRQLILSMLASVSASPLAAQALSAELEEEVIDSPTAEVVVEATSLDTLRHEVIKSPLDDRDYLAYTLDNGLQVLLCSDPSTSEAAVAMDVHVGATSDPVDVRGLAHFNEHMLFLGTEKYPKENDFEAFLSNNGGSSNAYTDSEDTVYFFDMEADAESQIKEGLLRFGSFFTSPLFTASATGRELNAIESENKKNLQTDSFRVFQLEKARANRNHPFSKFYTGNRQTLLEDTKAKGIDLREELIKFYNSHYSANQMTLAVVAPQSIEKLQAMVKDAMSEIPNRKVDKPELSWAGIPPYNVGNCIIPSFGYVVEAVPVQDLRQVSITWPIVYRSEEDRQDALLYKTTNYVAGALGHEGPNSLLAYLKRMDWATSLSAGDEEELSDFENFQINVGLTSQGLASVDKVVETIFSFIAMMRDRTVPPYILNETLQLNELQWRYLTKGSPRTYATSLATSMQKYIPEYYVAGPRRIALDGPEIIGSAPRMGFPSEEQLARTRLQVDKLVSQLTVDNGIITVLSKTFENLTNQKEKWYGTNYRVRPIPSSTMKQWKSPVAAKKLKIDFPRPNRFIPSEEGLKVKIAPLPVPKLIERTFESRMVPVTPPRVIRDDGPGGRWKVYFKEDDRFGKPKAYIIFQVLTQEVFASAKKAALANLFELAVSDRLGEYAYDAELAALTYEVKVLPRGVRLTFGGYNDKLKEFASYVSAKLSKDIRKILPKTDTDFQIYKDQIMRALSAFDVKQPYAHASYYGQLSLMPRRFQYTNKELRDETRSIVLPDLLAYADSLWSSAKGEALIQGNFDEREALGIVKSIGDAIPFRPLPDSEVPPRLEALPLPISRAEVVPTRLLISEPNPQDENSVSYIVLQSLGKSERDHVLIELLSAIVDQPFYSDLRTKQQLGYIVSSGVRGIAGTRTLSFIVQSNVAPSAVLSLQIIKFLDEVEEKILQKLTRGDIAVYVKSLVDRKTERDKDLAIEVTRNWGEISTGRLQFDRLQKEAAALLDVEKEDLIAFWRKLYSNDGRRALITEVIPTQGDASSPRPPSSTGYETGDSVISGLILGVEDLDDFRSDREKLRRAEELLVATTASVDM